MRYYYDYSFPIGNLTIEEDGHGICGIYFGTKTLEGEKKNTELIREAALQLSQYFDGRRKKFDLKLSYHGTEFQIKVWKALEKIPYGETVHLQRHCGISRNSQRMSSCRYGEQQESDRDRCSMSQSDRNERFTDRICRWSGNERIPVGS